MINTLTSLRLFFALMVFGAHCYVVDSTFSTHFYIELEAEIVAHAGEAGAVTIATNMAGRGTDITLDDVAKAAGGLKIIGTVRHESRRIDNQLRRRSGRQGDPGESRFYISLEDDLMRLFGSEKLMGIFKSLGVPENEH